MTYFNKQLTLLLFSLLFVFQACNNGGNNCTPDPGYKYLTGVTAERRFTKEEIIKMINAISPGGDISSMPFAATITDVDVAAITYTTKGVDGMDTQASGIVAMCVGTQSYDNLLSIQHGTLDAEEAPSLVLFNFEILPVVTKRVVVMADYLGYGASQTATRQHPYLHLSSTGIDCADMIEAAREYLLSKGVKENSDKVELMGYSQGGTSTIATVLEMEKRGISSRIIDAHSGGGAYDLVVIMKQFVAAGHSPFPRTGYLPFLIRGMEYGENMIAAPEKVYAPEVLNEGSLEVFKTKSISQWHDKLGTNITKVLHSDFYFDPTYNDNTEVKKVVAALQKNSLTSINAPSTPVKLYHSKADDFVPYVNAEAFHNTWKNTTLIELSSQGHIASGVEFILKFMGVI